MKPTFRPPGAQCRRIGKALEKTDPIGSGALAEQHVDRHHIVQIDQQLVVGLGKHDEARQAPVGPPRLHGQIAVGIAQCPDGAEFGGGHTQLARASTRRPLLTRGRNGAAASGPQPNPRAIGASWAARLHRNR